VVTARLQTAANDGTVNGSWANDSRQPITLAVYAVGEWNFELDR
jgi:hypothetical protein